MALTYNGTSPLVIKYGTTDLTIVEYGTTALWGKAYTLSISAGANTTITVNRTSSPNQHASTGNLSNGSLIYYGDTLTISYSVSSGYAIATHTVNGTTFTSGSSFTVSSNISVVTTAQQAGPSWHTVWSGTTSIPYSYSGNYVTIKSGIGNSSATSTRITGYAIVYESMGGDEYAPYDSVSWNGTTLPIAQTLGSYSYIYLGVGVRMNGNNLQGYVNGVYDDYTAVITKVEQYY